VIDVIAGATGIVAGGAGAVASRTFSGEAGILKKYYKSITCITKIN
jgi:hypothetical protein